MKMFLGAYLFLYSITSFSQFNLDQLANNFGLHDSSFYLIGRGTKSKTKVISEYNFEIKSITHIGIAIATNKGLKVYHVTDNVGLNQTAMKVESIREFLNNPDVQSFGLWACNLSMNEFNKALNVLDSFSHLLIKFDSHFSLGIDNNLYCSEYCSRVLNLINEKKFRLITNKVKIKDTFVKLFLRREELEYIPVDFFVKYNFIHLVYEFR